MRSERIIAPLIGLFTAIGCAGARVISADHPVELDLDEGILVVHIDSDFPIRRLRFGTRFDAAKGIEAGEHLALVVVPAGRYRWKTLEIPFGGLGGGLGWYYRFRLRRDSDWTFDVKPGRINYPGQVIVRGSHRELHSRGMLHAWTENRSALALERLVEAFPTSLARFTMVNGRGVRDDFLEHYYQHAPNTASSAAEPASK